MITGQPLLNAYLVRPRVSCPSFFDPGDYPLQLQVTKPDDYQISAPSGTQMFDYAVIVIEQAEDTPFVCLAGWGDTNPVDGSLRLHATVMDFNGSNRDAIWVWIDTHRDSTPVPVLLRTLLDTGEGDAITRIINGQPESPFAWDKPGDGMFCREFPLPGAPSLRYSRLTGGKDGLPLIFMTAFNTLMPIEDCSVWPDLLIENPNYIAGGTAVPDATPTQINTLTPTATPWIASPDDCEAAELLLVNKTWPNTSETVPDLLSSGQLTMCQKVMETVEALPQSDRPYIDAAGCYPSRLTCDGIGCEFCLMAEVIPPSDMPQGDHIEVTIRCGDGSGAPFDGEPVLDLDPSGWFITCWKPGANSVVPGRYRFELVARLANHPEIQSDPWPWIPGYGPGYESSATEIRVDQKAAGRPGTPDGSREHPYTTIQAALDAAKEVARNPSSPVVVRVWPGTYLANGGGAPIEIPDHVHVLAEDPTSGGCIIGTTYNPDAIVCAGHSRLAGFTIFGTVSARGLNWPTPVPDGPVTVADCSFMPNVNSPVPAVIVSEQSDVKLANCMIDGASTGVYMTGVSGLTLESCSISNCVDAVRTPGAGVLRVFNSNITDNSGYAFNVTALGGGNLLNAWIETTNVYNNGNLTNQPGAIPFIAGQRGNFAADPLFESGPFHDFYLDPESPCRGVANSLSLSAANTQATHERQDGPPDIGYGDVLDYRQYAVPWLDEREDDPATPDGGWHTWIALANPNPYPLRVTLTPYHADGTPEDAVTVQLDPRASALLAAADEFPDIETGSCIIDSDGPLAGDVRYRWSDGGQEAWHSIPLIEVKSDSTAAVPWIITADWVASEGLGEFYSQTFLSVQNPSADEAVSITMRFFAPDGAPYMVDEEELVYETEADPRETVRVSLPSYAIPGTGFGNVEITASGSIAGSAARFYVSQTTGNAASQGEEMQSMAAASSHLVLPHYYAVEGGSNWAEWESWYVLKNLTDDEITATATEWDETGEDYAETEIEIDPHATVTNPLLPGETFVNGSLEIEASGGGLLGYYEIIGLAPLPTPSPVPAPGAAHVVVASANLGPDGGPEGLFWAPRVESRITQTESVETWLTVANPSDSDVAVVITFYDTDGGQAGDAISLTLGPHELTMAGAVDGDPVSVGSASVAASGYITGTVERFSVSLAHPGDFDLAVTQLLPMKE